MNKSERLAIIERMLLARREVHFAELQERLEVSRATLFRDLEFLRDRMQVPIVCDRDTGCYRIDRTSPRHELPGLWFSPGEIHALLSMQRLLAEFDPAGILAEHVGSLRERLLGMLESASDSAEEIGRRIRIVSAAARHCAPQHFPTIAAALMERRQLNIQYRARSNGLTSHRTISPQRLTHYRDNWYLDAWCHLRDELRSFAVDAILEAKTTADAARDIPQDELDATLGAGYGIFSGTTVQWATLRFTAERARWVASEQWHPAQQAEFLSDGRYQLRVPYSQDHELIMDILKYGADCEVAAPVTLRERVIEQLQKSLAVYGLVSCSETVQR